MWRSLVARYTGGVEVAGSNPVIPTKCTVENHCFQLFGVQTCCKVEPANSVVLLKLLPVVCQG